MNARRKRTLGAISAVAALALAGGVAAQFTTSTTSAPQQIGTGTMALSLDSVAPTVWTDPIENLAAGDSVQRFVDLRNSGSLKMSGITLSQTNTLGSLLTEPSDVRLTLESCSVAWNVTTGACAGTQMVVLGQNSVRDWAGSAKSLSTFEAFGAGEIRHLRFTTQLAPGATNAVQNKSGQITYTFSGAQRAAGTYGQVSDAYTPLNAPTNVAVAPSGDALVASWTDTNAGQVPYTVGYSINGGSMTKVALAKGVTSYTLNAPTPGATYDFAVFATAGAEAATVPAPSISVLQAPALSLSQTGTTSLRANITDNSGGKATYKLTYTAAGGAATTVSLPAGTLSYDLTGLQLATDYTVAVTATQGTQTKTTSATSTLPINQAGSMALTATDTTMKVDFTDTNAGQATYVLSYAPAAGGASVSVPLAAGATSATATGLSASTSYVFTLTATKNGKTATVTSTKSTAAPSGPVVVNIESSSWSGVAGLPSQPYAPTSTVDNNGDFYLFGGSDSITARKYTVATNTWSSVKPIPVNVNGSTSQTAPDGASYVMGGNGSKAVQKYTPSSDSWSAMTPMPVSVANTTSQITADGFIYVLGGYDSANGPVNTVQKYSIASNSWTTVAPIPVASYGATSQLAADGSIYVFGGSNAANVALSTVYRYVPSTNSWSTLASMPTASFYATSQVAMDGSIYVFGGGKEGPNYSTIYSSALQKYNPSTNTWTTPKNLPWTRYQAKSARDAQGRIYLIGGLKNGTWSTDVDRLS